MPLHNQRPLRLAALAAAAFATASAAHAAPKVEAAWTRPAAQGGTGAGFMILKNPDPKADALVAVETPLAGMVHIHQSSIKDGIATMQSAASASVPAGGQLSFQPGGYHLMFMGLTRALKVGDVLPATLVFSSGARVQTAFAVRVAAPPAKAK